METANHTSLVDEVYAEYADQEPMQGNLIPILQNVQARLGYVPADAITRIAQLLRIPPSQVYSVATFYHQFRLRPRGEHTITVCRGTACHVKGSLDTYNYIAQQLGIKSPQDTSSDGAFTIQQVRCLGACGLAPVMKVDETVYGRVNHKKIKAVLRSVREGGEKK